MKFTLLVKQASIEQQPDLRDFTLGKTLMHRSSWQLTPYHRNEFQYIKLQFPAFHKVYIFFVAK